MVEDFDEHNWICKVTLPDGRVVKVLIPKGVSYDWIYEETEVFGLNLTTQGHYE